MNALNAEGISLSAWANSKSRYTETGIVLEHVNKPYEGNDRDGILMDHQPLSYEIGEWQTATLEVVGDEALYRLGDQIAYAKRPEISIGPKNTVSLTMGPTWHEIKRVRIWHAEANPEWEANKDNILKSRQPFTIRPR